MRLFYDISPTDEFAGGGGTNPPPAKVAPKPVVGPPKGATPAPSTPTGTPPTAGTIPLPNYDDPKSRLQYAQNWTKKYGPLMQNRGDTPLHVNSVPDVGPDTDNAKNLSTNAAKKYGLDPALLYSSAMEEGMSGLFKDKEGNVNVGEHTSDKFPVSGYGNFGLDTFADKFNDMVKKGYLPKEFVNKFQKSIETNEKGEKVNSANFVDVASALQAKSALLKATYDDIDSYAKQRKITLSPKARDFFALADYNGGEGLGHQMLNDYYNAGQLEGDRFLQARPISGGSLKATSYGPLYDKKGVQTDEGMYSHIMRRIKMAQALKDEKLFD